MSSNLQILGASWGLRQITSTIIDKVNRANQTLSISADNNTLGGDGWPGSVKTLFVAYRYGDTGKVGTAIAKEGQSLSISSPPSAGIETPAAATQPQLTVYAAAYGPADKTSTVQGLISPASQSLSFTANDQVFGDPWSGFHKSFTIVAAYTGQLPFTDVIQEGQNYALKYRPQLSILSAVWGLSDVTSTIAGMVYRRTLNVNAVTSIFGDPWPGVKKALVVIGQYGTQQPHVATAVEGSPMVFEYYGGSTEYQPPRDPDALNIIGVSWGQVDVTSKVQALVKDNTLNFTANDGTFGDPWPGNRKGLVLLYSWGSNAPLSWIAQEGDTIQLTIPPRPVVRSGLNSTTGMIASGDEIVLQSGPGMYLAAGANGQILANAASTQQATTFTVKVTTGATGQDTVTLTTGSQAVTVGQDGTLYAIALASPATFIISFTNNGSVTLSLVGGSSLFAMLGDDNSVIASGSSELTFRTTFGLMLNPTAVGFDNHLTRLGVDLAAAPQAAGDVELLSLVWDLTGGFFLAIGLGPLLAGSPTIKTGILELIRLNAKAAAALNLIISTAKATLGTTLRFGLVLAFVGTIWDQGLMWKIFRMALKTGAIWLVGWAGAKILEVTVLPEVAAAELVVSFGLWAYETTTDAVAYINATSGTPVTSSSAVKMLALESNGVHDSAANGINGDYSNGDYGHGDDGGDEDDEQDLEDQLRTIAIQRKLRLLRKRRATPSAVLVEA